MSKQLNIIKVTPIIKRPGHVPTRVILHKWRDLKGWGMEYATHIQCMPRGEKPYQVWGHYTTDLDGAMRDFNDRAQSECERIGKKYDSRANRCR